MYTTTNTKWIVVTDLDGTLLNHHDYDYREARPALDLLRHIGIPVIMNSSKTAAEIDSLRVAMSNDEPYIVENGSAILVPKSKLAHPPKDAKDFDQSWEIVLGKPRQELLKVMQQVPEKLKHCFQSYSQSSVDDVMLMTGLSKKDAKASMNRHYSEPLKWQGSFSQKQEFYNFLRKHHIHHTEGGRFIHLLGQTNKGSAIRWLKNYFTQLSGEATRVIAMGDAENDVDMFTSADVAGVVRSPVNNMPEFEHPRIIVSKETGAMGWSEIIHAIFTSDTHSNQAKQDQEWLTSTKTVS